MKITRRVFAAASAAGLLGAQVAPSWTAIQGACAWPNLQRLADGTLVATIFNQPCHGEWEGDLDCWASKDDGKTWKFHGRPGPHEARTNRMNCAAGLAANGDMVVLVSGWSNREPIGVATPATRGQVLKPWVCRSKDGGKTWTHTTAFPDPTTPGADSQLIPFGDIHLAADGSLVASVYSKMGKGWNDGVVRSRDDGRTWGNWVEVSPLGNETAILHVGGGKWLAASRMSEKVGEAPFIALFTSEDDAKTWKRGGPLTLPGQITGHLTKLKDGRVLLSYGNRNRGNFGVDGRMSSDGGVTWDAPFRIAVTPESDCGYPASAQLGDGNVVTVYYTRVSPGHFYEMRVTIWGPGSRL